MPKNFRRYYFVIPIVRTNILGITRVNFFNKESGAFDDFMIPSLLNHFEKGSISDNLNFENISTLVKDGILSSYPRKRGELKWKEYKMESLLIEKRELPVLKIVGDGTSYIRIDSQKSFSSKENTEDYGMYRHAHPDYFTYRFTFEYFKLNNINPMNLFTETEIRTSLSLFYAFQNSFGDKYFPL